MTDWTAGYVADIGYTYGYYPELNPLKVRLAFLQAGLVPPEICSACELGFGQGLSIAIHAAAGNIEWQGTDFNPAQASFARELVDVSGSGAQVHDDAFAEFAQRDDLPMFDYIGLHGIWSWISDANRAVIVDFLRRKLKVGGVVFMSYNTLPGWAGFAPLRQLLTEHAKVMSPAGIGTLARINASLGFVDQFMALKPSYARMNPGVATRLEKLKEQNRNYLAHEYFNEDWQPMYFANVAEWLAPAKLDFACSAHYLDHVGGINFTPEQVQLLSQTPDTNFREGLKDFLVNQQFRRDYWVKGPRQLAPLQRLELLANIRVMLCFNRPDVPMKATGGLGEISMREEIFKPVLDFLADNEIRTIGEIASAVVGKDLSMSHVLEAVLILCGTGHLAPVQDAADIERQSAAARRLNLHVIDKARNNNEINYLASPVTGGGVMVNRFQQLFLQIMLQGSKEPKQLADHVWAILRSQGQKLVKNGKPVESVDENLAELMSQAESFIEKTLPILQKLGIA